MRKTVIVSSKSRAYVRPVLSRRGRLSGITRGADLVITDVRRNSN